VGSVANAIAGAFSTTYTVVSKVFEMIGVNVKAILGPLASLFSGFTEILVGLGVLGKEAALSIVEGFGKLQGIKLPDFHGSDDAIKKLQDKIAGNEYALEFEEIQRKIREGFAKTADAAAQSGAGIVNAAAATAEGVKDKFKSSSMSLADYAHHLKEVQIEAMMAGKGTVGTGPERGIAAAKNANKNLLIDRQAKMADPGHESPMEKRQREALERKKAAAGKKAAFRKKNPIRAPKNLAVRKAMKANTANEQKDAMRGLPGGNDPQMDTQNRVLGEIKLNLDKQLELAGRPPGARMQ
jgi:hypothetical protein